VVEATVPARKTGADWFGCPHVDKQLQKSSGGVWSRISSAFAQQKLRQGRVNGDLARSERRWVKPTSGAASERYVGDSGLYLPKKHLQKGWGEGPDEDSGWRESAIQWFDHRQKR